ncbi:hypothetical protein ACSMXM_03910 [Pacificimonas sp. ICDLI1SI03]
MPLDVDIAGSSKRSVRSEFGVVATDDHLRCIPLGDQIGQLATTPAGDRRIDDCSMLPSGYIIDDVEHQKLRPVPSRSPENALSRNPSGIVRYDETCGSVRQEVKRFGVPQNRR